jgi:hypothetical protein
MKYAPLIMLALLVLVVVTQGASADPAFIIP